MEYKNLHSYDDFLNEKKKFIDELNEGLFGKLYGWAGDLIKQGTIKKALKKQTEEGVEKMKERLAKEFEITLTKKNGGDLTTLEQELEILKDEEQNIKDEFKNAIDTVIKKKPNLKNKLKKLEIQEKKTMLSKMREMLVSFSKDDKYAEIADEIKNRIKSTKENDQKLDNELKNITSDKKEVDKKVGEIYKYKTKDGDDVKILLSKVDSKEDGTIETIKAYRLHIKKLKNENKVTVGDEFTPVLNNIGEKIDDSSIEAIFGTLDKFEELKNNVLN